MPRVSDLFLAVLWEVYDTEEELPPDDEPERKEQADAFLPRDAVPATRAVRLLRAVVALRDVVEDEEEDPRLRKCAPAAACVDSNPKCAEWKGSGECDRNPKFMLETCRKSCGKC